MGFNIERADKPFVVKSPYKPSGDQPQAIAELAERIENGENDVVLMGATGTGKTATTAVGTRKEFTHLSQSRVFFNGKLLGNSEEHQRCYQRNGTEYQDRNQNKIHNNLYLF